MRQRELFPEAFDVEADALDALEELEIDRGAACLARARAADPTLANLDALEAALRWLEGALAGERDERAVARAFLARPDADLTGAAGFVDRALARRGLALTRGAFLDADRLVPRAALLLVLDRRAAAWRDLAALAAEIDGEHEDRGDVAGYAADAAHLAGEPERANPLLVRALVADPARIDLARIRNPDISALARELAAQTEDDALVRARLFPEAWLRGLVRVPAGNAWLDAARSRLFARFPPGVREPAARLRRFALLLFADRSRPAGDVDLAAREELAELAPELFARVIARLRQTEST